MATLTIDARTFAELVQPVLPFAARDTDVPLLASVHLFVVDGMLYAGATDRYRMAWHRRTVEGGEGFDFLIDRRAVPAITRTFKATRHENPSLRFTVEGDELTVEAGGAMEGLGISGASLTFRRVEGNYPPLGRLLPWGKGATDPMDVPLNPRFLADLSNFAGVAEPVVIHPPTAPGKPVIISRGEDFLACIQPVRHPSEGKSGTSRALEHWAAALRPAEAAD